MPLPARRRNFFVLVASLLFCGGFSTLASQASSPDQSLARSVSQKPALPASPNELVRQVIQNELKDRSSRTRFMYRIRKDTPNGSQTKEYVETNDGTVARLIAINGQPLSADQRKKEDERLQRLLTDPQAQQKHRKEQQEDQQRVNRMLRSLPDAFIYTYDGEENYHGGPVVRLKFKPNPNFNPPNHETQVYRGMVGSMLIGPRAMRLAKIAGNLVHEVSFGWGILGHLDPGGHFIVEQADVGEGHWETISTNLSFTGRVLWFHRLNIKENEVASDFVLAPRDLSLAQGIELLKSRTPSSLSDSHGSAALNFP